MSVGGGELWDVGIHSLEFVLWNLIENKYARTTINQLQPNSFNTTVKVV